MGRKREAECVVSASPETTSKFASDADLVANWTGGFPDCRQVNGGCINPHAGKCLIFDCVGSKGYTARWHLTLAAQPGEPAGQEKTKITAAVSMSRNEKFRAADVLWRIWPRKQPYPATVQSSVDRVKSLAEAPSLADFKVNDHVFGIDNLLSLLTVYTSQFGSYTTLLWQVPALGLTAQAFLLMIALTSKNTHAAIYASSALSVIIAVSSVALMHDQRGRAINQAELAKRLSCRLSVKDFLGGNFSINDAAPMTANAQDVWAVNHVMYMVWQICMSLFIFVDAAVVYSTLANRGWF
jgi:hypothetical protein